MPKYKTTARIHNPARRQFWREIFNADTVPIKSIVPSCVDLPENPDALVYFLDLDALTPEQRRRLVHSLARRFNLASAYVAANIDQQGVPILADEVSLVTTDRRLVMSLMAL